MLKIPLGKERERGKERGKRKEKSREMDAARKDKEHRYCLYINIYIYK